MYRRTVGAWVRPSLLWTWLFAATVGVSIGVGGCSQPPAPSSQTPTAQVLDPELVAAGQIVAQQYACLNCHSVDGSRWLGPTWKGLYGSEVTFTDGSTTVVTEGYLKEAIKDPSGRVVEGYSPIMPPQLPASEEEVDALVAYIMSLAASPGAALTSPAPSGSPAPTTLVPEPGDGSDLGLAVALGLGAVVIVAGGLAFVARYRRSR